MRCTTKSPWIGQRGDCTCEARLGTNLRRIPNKVTPPLIAVTELTANSGPDAAKEEGQGGQEERKRRGTHSRVNRNLNSHNFRHPGRALLIDTVEPVCRDKLKQEITRVENEKSDLSLELAFVRDKLQQKTANADNLEIELLELGAKLDKSTRDYVSYTSLACGNCAWAAF